MHHVQPSTKNEAMAASIAAKAAKAAAQHYYYYSTSLKNLQVIRFTTLTIKISYIRI